MTFLTVIHRNNKYQCNEKVFLKLKSLFQLITIAALRLRLEFVKLKCRVITVVVTFIDRITYIVGIRGMETTRTNNDTCKKTDENVFLKKQKLA